VSDPTFPTARAVRRGVVAGAVALALGLGGAIVSTVPAWAVPIDVTTEAELIAAAAAPTEEILIHNDILLTATVSFPIGTKIRGIDDTVTITGNGNFNFFEFVPSANSQDFTIESLEFDGTGTGGSALYLVDMPATQVSDFVLDGVDIHDFIAGFGAGIYIEDTALSAHLDVRNSHFTDNDAVVGGGGAIGGHLFQARVTLTDTEFARNTGFGGGAVDLDHTGGAASFIATRVTATDNTGGPGGAFNLQGFFNSTQITDSTFTGNTAAGDGGAINGTEMGFLVTISGTRFEDNTAMGGSGGAVALTDTGDVTVTGASRFIANDAGLIGGALYVDTMEDLNLNGSSVFDQNTALYQGGAVAMHNLSGGFIVDTVAFTSNEVSQIAGAAGSGGAVFSDGSPAQHRVTAAQFIGNSGFYGGAMYVAYSDGDFAIGRTTFDQNGAGGDPVQPGFGGAIYLGEVRNTGYARFFNSTFSNNTLQTGVAGYGVAIAIFEVQTGGTFQLGEDTFYQPTQTEPAVEVGETEADSAVEISRSTFVGAGGVFINLNAGEASVTHTIIDATLLPGGTGLAIGAGNPWNLEWSILGDTPLPANIVDVAGNQFDTGPQLGPLQNNGGPTLTMEPLPGSPAIDMGDPNIAGYTPYDQRVTGFPRLVGPRIDIGAIEVQAPELAATGGRVSWWLLFVAGGVLILGAGALTFTRRGVRG
jgi:predicted outer membrane repeat protein